MAVTKKSKRGREKPRAVKAAIRNIFRRRISVNISERAFLKIIGLVEGYEGEVGWHGTVKRPSENSFEIEDIFVYPQTVSGSSIDTKQADYEAWLMTRDDEVFNNLRVHGHSHVHFRSIPSPKDDRHRGSILEMLKGDMFYIFMIWNKRNEVHMLVYDNGPKIRYEKSNTDITVTIDGECVPLKDVDMEKAKTFYERNNVTEFVNGSREIVQPWSELCREESMTAWEQVL